jgi:hypothetical protein
MLFVDPATRAIVANEPDLEGRLAKVQDVWIGTLAPEVQPSNTAIDWAGVRWTMVMWNAVPSTTYERGRLLMHESFHRVQPSLGFSPASPINSHLDEEDGRAWLRLEMRALAEAMIRSGPERRRAAEDAVLFRSARRSKVGAAASDDEVALEANEGLAEYTGLALCGLPRAAMEQRAAVGLEQHDQSAALTRSFAYATGPALGLLLDEFEPGWRTSAAQNPNLAARLAKSVGGETSDDPVVAAQRISDRYGGATIFTDERARSQKRIARLAELRAAYVDGRVLRITCGPSLRFSFNPSSAEAIDSARVVYTSFHASDAWGTLDAPAGAMLSFESPMSISIPVPKGATAESVPWKLNVNPGYRLDAPTEGPWRVVSP